MLLHDAAQRFQVQLHANGRAEATRLQFARHLALLIGWLQREKHGTSLGDIDDQAIASFLASQAARLRPDGKPKKASSMNALRSSVRGFFGYCHEAGLVDRNPARLVRMAICAPPPPRAIRDHEELKLRKVLEAGQGVEGERDLVLFELMITTGVRLSSALGLDVEDMDLEDDTIHLRTLKRGGEQAVFLPRMMRELLIKFLGSRERGPVFCSASGHRITPRHAQRRFRQARERAGISRAVSPHGCRHRFAMTLYERTHDLLVVQSALGHASLSSSLAYARADESRVRQVVAGLSSAG